MKIEKIFHRNEKKCSPLPQKNAPLIDKNRFLTSKTITGNKNALRNFTINLFYVFFNLENKSKIFVINQFILHSYKRNQRK